MKAHTPYKREMMLAKKRLREEMLARRRALPDSAGVKASSAICRQFTDHPLLSFATSVAGYMPMRAELDVLPLLAHLAGRRHCTQTALPRMDEKTRLLQFRRWSAGDALDVSTFGVREPKPDTLSLIPQIVLTPLLAFDATGARLGYGGGWYDRTIRALREAGGCTRFIGVGYASQEVDAVPCDGDDAMLDGILTEFGVSMF